MEKKSIVKNVQGSGTFDFNGKTFYKNEVEMANGDCGEYNSLSEKQDRFIIGIDTDYIFDTSKPQYPKIKPVYNFNSSPSRDGNLQNVQKAAGIVPTPQIVQEVDTRQRMIVKQSSLKIAVEFCVNKYKAKTELSHIFEAADEILDYVLNDKIRKTPPNGDPDAWRKPGDLEKTNLN